ncbi:hypothetical protein DOTSEDRAFT_73804 [Dothistroma septosporum NZE10]|uniref:Major facilitator superfamily (MFS) profile domain-containing protein n=1 Tax=Dothistroma septosporum (strain NZE10 / CBS 128990) TaxID=675120 RepID=N1PIY4_DOTSN|nr:hypothetical protein DOTSEDRAFT_73804 [Dothistroma septosporum NZE10]
MVAAASNRPQDVARASEPGLDTTIAGSEQTPPPPPPQPPWTVLSEGQKKLYLIIAAFAAAISPFSTSTYYPSVVALAQDFNVSVSKINLTISTYQIFQGIAPTFIAAFADTFGRRPAYLVCFSIYFCANLGLALQSSYAALLVLRCLQSSGSSGTAAIAQAVTYDLATRGERGKYLAYAIMAATVGPALGPIAGGLLTQYLGWRAVFWFLLILGSVICLLIFIAFPETARPIVGDGSVPPQPWNKSLLQMLSKESLRQPANPDSVKVKPRHFNPFTSLILLKDPENFVLCIAGGFLYAGYSSVTSVFASQLQERFQYNEVQVGLCYLPIAFGSLTAGATSARLIDWSFRKEATKQGLSVEKNRQTDITHFDTEKARLFYAFPMVALATALAVGYGWEMQSRAPLAAILVTVFFLSNALTGALVANTALLTDINRKNAAAVGAATNLTRCLLSAGGVAAITPLINQAGIGWASTIVATMWAAAGAAFWLVYVQGFRWRVKRAAKKSERKGQSKRETEGERSKVVADHVA